MLAIEQSAAQEIKKLLSEDRPEVLYIAIRGGGCSGFEYQLSIADAAELEAELTEISGIPVYIAPDAAPFLEQAKLTYQYSEDVLQPGGFKFENPQYSSCGCGKSFGC